MKTQFYYMADKGTNSKPLKEFETEMSFRKGDTVELDEYLFEVKEIIYRVMRDPIQVIYIDDIGKMFV